MMKHRLFCLAILPLFFLPVIHGGKQVFTNLSFFGSATEGVLGNAGEQAYFLLKDLFLSEDCAQTYGFLPCSTTVVGNMLFISAYGYLMFQAAKRLSEGCEILLEILGPGIIGGLVLPILSALPDAIVILASGLSGSKETAQDQVSVGMGLLAGSIVMLLTLLWGSCVVVGKCDLVDANARDEVDTKGFSLTGSGVSTDIWTTYAARIMVLSVTPFVIVQLPQVLNTTAESRLFILTALILSIALLISYCLYQVFQPKVQKRRLAFAKYKHVMSGILTCFRTRTLGRILSIDGRPDRDVIKKLFQSLDVNEDGNLSAEELRALIVGIRFDEVDVDVHDIDDAVKSILKEFDKSEDSLIDEEEFANGISSWIYRAMRSAKYAKVQCPDSDSPHLKFLSEFYQQTRKERDLLGDSSDDDDRGIKNPRWNAFKAVMMLLSGTAAVCGFANPLVDAVNNFSSATRVPTFFVSFVVLPFASCSEGVSALIFIRNKKHKTASLTFSQIYGSVTMSNILSLSVFLGLVYVRELTWSFTSEVVVILIVCTLMGIFASFRTTFPLWTCLLAFSLYPLSILLVYVLAYVVALC
ncbi:hypothetical protein RHMOL_Rhmol04G0100800 [Rhododendron molle]|uniref:Uncharacterized protein n=1 Tax=Rhododendron molle TaxID=49168 RepID=A0ACC0NZ81_RHOML|nr:hypothetical protein RHMOL_Rhmol04G0100800 [Rhododendron molle]